MSKKEYDWANGATLSDHSRVKLRILEEYFREYLKVRCVLPQQEKFRLAIVDGFCGAGIYGDGTHGSPVIFLNVLRDVSRELNLVRAIQGLKSLDIECSLFLNDVNPEAISLLRENIAPIASDILDSSNLKVEIVFNQGAFEVNVEAICEQIRNKGIKNSLFNLDQYGYTQVSENTLRYVMSTSKSTEIFFTFAIESFLTYLTPERALSIASTSSIPFSKDLVNVDRNQNKKQWLGSIERVVFESLKNISQFVSPFSIHNPNGWRYWLVHFANSHRARQVYNDVLHKRKSAQAHFGRSGLNMLYYDPREEFDLYLFDSDSRSNARNQLDRDIPAFLENNGRAMTVDDFYSKSYNHTPAHSDDINLALVNNPDLKVITPSGGERRSIKTIRAGDLIKLRDQRSFFMSLQA